MLKIRRISVQWQGFRIVEYTLGGEGSQDWRSAKLPANINLIEVEFMLQNHWSRGEGKISEGDENDIEFHPRKTSESNLHMQPDN